MVKALNHIAAAPPYRTSNFQASVQSIHFYPFVVVIEKPQLPIAELRSSKRGTHWQPFIK
jgi:hypothetical protein